MIKSLLGEDENLKEKDKTSGAQGEEENSAKNPLSVTETITTQEDVKTENSLVDTLKDEIETIDEIKTAINTGKFPSKETNTDAINNPQTVRPFEVDKPIGRPIVEKTPDKTESGQELKSEAISQGQVNTSRALELEKKLREIEEELKIEKELELHRLKKETAEKIQIEQQKIQKVEPIEDLQTEENTVVRPKQEETALWNDGWDKENKAINTEDESLIQIKPKDFVPESKAEGVRKMGMAWSAAIAFFGSVVFMLVLGWGADLLLGSEPWGIVVGIIFGATIGFIQLIRTTSQIFKPRANDFDKVSLRSNIESVESKKVEEIADSNLDESKVKTDNVTAESTSEIPIQKVLDNAQKIDDETETIIKTDS